MVVLSALGCLRSPVATNRASSASSCSSSSSFSSSSSHSNSIDTQLLFTKRKALIFTSSLVSSYLNIYANSSLSSVYSAIALQVDDIQQEEDRVVQLFQETSPSVVFIKDLELDKVPKRSAQVALSDDENAKVEGTGSGFIWDKFGHIVTNYHVVAKVATDKSGLHRCKISLFDAKGNSFSTEGKIVGSDPDNDLAVLKINVEGDELKPVTLGISQGLRVGQSCFAIGNPYGYANSLTTGVISGLGREIPSPNGRAIRGAIQTDAAINAEINVQLMQDYPSFQGVIRTFIENVHIGEPEDTACHNSCMYYFHDNYEMLLNAGNSGGPLIDSYGHVIGVNTAAFTRKGTGISSGVNFAIPVDTVLSTVPYLIVYGTPYADRY